MSAGLQNQGRILLLSLLRLSLAGVHFEILCHNQAMARFQI
jgi:hypothetical protein